MARAGTPISLRWLGNRSVKSNELPLLSGALRWLNRSIGARLVALFLGLLLVVQVASFTALRASLTSHAHGTLPDKLRVGSRVLQTLLERQAQTLIEAAHLLAADHAFREAVLADERADIVAVLAAHGQQVGADQTAFLGNDFELRAATVIDRRELAALVARMAPVAKASGRAGEIALLAGRPHQVVLVPMRAPLAFGWVLMGFPLEARLASDMRSLAALNITLLARAGAAAAWSSSLSSLTPAQTRALAEQAWSARRGPQDTPANVTLQSEAFEALPLWLSTPAADGSVLAVVSLSVDEAVRFWRSRCSALPPSCSAA
jgi:hypothetical protein